jgi:hypothetical protein
MHYETKHWKEETVPAMFRIPKALAEVKKK